MSEPTTVYKILRPHEWAEAQRVEHYDGAPVDHADGYIHFSGPDQVAETARRYFDDTDTVHVLALDPAAMQPGAFVWEPSRGGALFPHLYAPMPMAAVTGTWTLTRGEDGSFNFSAVPGATDA